MRRTLAFATTWRHESATIPWRRSRDFMAEGPIHPHLVCAGAHGRGRAGSAPGPGGADRPTMRARPPSPRFSPQMRAASSKRSSLASVPMSAASASGQRIGPLADAAERDRCPSNDAVAIDIEQHRGPGHREVPRTPRKFHERVAVSGRPRLEVDRGHDLVGARWPESCRRRETRSSAGTASHPGG